MHAEARYLSASSHLITLCNLHTMTTTLFLVLTMALVSSTTAINQDMVIATQEMQRANYFTFVMLLNMAPIDTFAGNVTFLMPNDRALANATAIAGTSVLDFLQRHSIPSPLLIDHLEHFPTGSMIPTSKPGFMLRVSNDGRRRLFLGNVRITSPNICTRGTSIRCHGVDGVAQPAMVPQTGMLPTPTCSAAAPSSPPAVIAAPAPAPSPSPSVVQVSRQKSSSYRSAVIDLLTIYCVLPLMILWLSV